MLVLSIAPEDYPFVVEAIRLRTDMMINSLKMQVERQTRAPAEEQVDQEPVRKPVARWGYKKDGTPKKRPGRKA